jgi:hypothetical protein
MRLLPGVLLLATVLTGCAAPPPAATYTEPQLKYLLLDHYGEDRLFYCDPDEYPISRGDEAERALEAFPAIMNDTAEFVAITARKGLSPPYSHEAKLAIYREHKRLGAVMLAPRTAESYTFAMALGTEAEGRRVSGVVRTDGTIREETSEKAFLTCPICLAAGTRIETPAGPVPVEDLRERMIVWTVDAQGGRVAAPVLQTARTRAPPGHAMIRLRLSDNRTVAASPGHPAADGRPLSLLRVGDLLDGAVVSSAEAVPYGGEYVYDLLPAGARGMYWADGVLLGSTLR